MKKLAAIKWAPPLLMLVFTLTACEEQGPAERTGEIIDNAAEKTGEAIEEGAEKTEECFEDGVNNC
ncbi:MAG: hypothetical protein CMK32_15335 [Porticoccaceae bacterium]|nr:hypothetical protein [Porticoccaceae bacterium]